MADIMRTTENAAAEKAAAEKAAAEKAAAEKAAAKNAAAKNAANMIKYVGNKENFKLKRPEVSRAYDFSKGEVEVTEEDAKVLLKLFPKSFTV